MIGNVGKPRKTELLIQETAHFSAATWMFQLAQRLGFNLTNTLTGHAELLTNFFQRMVGVHADAETHAQHPFLTRCQACQERGSRFLSDWTEWRHPPE